MKNQAFCSEKNISRFDKKTFQVQVPFTFRFQAKIFQKRKLTIFISAGHIFQFKKSQKN
jgi:hypothetical protein